MNSQNDSVVSVSVVAMNENLAISEAAKESALPHPWARYWRDKRYEKAINAEKNGPYSWVVRIDKDLATKIGNEND
ncbi:MAG: hypothetical protein GF401_17350 [Chitinivibrionales bacterium]|nr:hypothetical protein [Chitinivibrionales bacterium]